MPFAHRMNTPLGIDHGDMRISRPILDASRQIESHAIINARHNELLR